MNLIKWTFERIAHYRPGSKPLFPGIGNRSDFEEAWAYWNFAVAIARRNKYERAIPYLKKAIVIYPFVWYFLWVPAMVA